ncbi:hypothetical protein [Kaistella sp.]|uniref:hypothetical protein n=1 Tax=Kaistella sp. TaxID=2782235 RepID=UPI003C412DF8
MFRKIILTSFGILTLVACQNKNAAVSSIKNENTQTNSQNTNSVTPKEAEPEMSTGLPPDAEAVKIAEQEQASSNQKNVVYLKEGENKFLKEYEMNVTFKNVIEDSRCPKDVQCVWTGNAIAEVEFMGLYTRPVTVQLSTMNNPNKGYFNTQSFNGYSISLVDLTPETTSAKGFKALQGSYKIALQFKKENAGDPQPQKGGATTK